MGQDLLYSVMPRINFSPSQLAYNRRVSKSDRSQTRSKYDDEHEDSFSDFYQQIATDKNIDLKKAPSDDREHIDAKA